MRRWLVTAWWALLLEGRRWVREPLGVLVALVVPAAVAGVVSLALGGGADYRTTWAVADLDRGPVAEAFLTQVPEDAALRDVVDIRETTVQEGRDLLDDYEVSALVVLPDALSERVLAGEGPGIRVERPAEPGIGTDLAEVAVDAFAVRTWGGVATGDLAGRGTEGFRVELRSADGRSIDAATHFGPSIALFFLFLSLGFGGQRAVEDRVRGISDRHRAAHLSTSAVAVGRSLFGAVIGGGSLAVTAAVMTLVFDRGWGPARVLVPLVVVIVACFGAIAALVAQVVRTPAAVQLVTGGLAFASMVASGGFAPPGVTTRAAFGGVLPTGRAIDALTTVATTDAGWGAIEGDIAFLAASAILCTVAASVLDRRF